jgi:hypothetical protein
MDTLILLLLLGGGGGGGWGVCQHFQEPMLYIKLRKAKNVPVWQH